MRYFILPALLISSFLLSAQNALPVINNLTANIDYQTRIITINYDVSDAEEAEVGIHLLVSADGGNGFVLNTSAATGDIGEAVPVGANKEITWEYGDALRGDGNYKIKLIADDHFQINIQDMVNMVNADTLLAKLNFITGPRHRDTGAAHLQAVKDRIETEIDAAGLHKQIQEIIISDYSMHNFIGRHGGHKQDSSVIIIDAHYDTTETSPGADDNGTGTVGVWEAMRVLSQFNFKKTLKFINFDLEEVALTGSSLFVQQGLHPDENYEAVLNFEMIGYATDVPNTQEIPLGFNLIFPEATAQIEADDNRGNFLTNVSNAASVDLMATFTAVSNSFVPELRIIELAAPGNATGALSDLRRSDHAPFWDAGIPALMLTDGANFRNPHYHTSNDNIGTINQTFFEQVVKATIATAATLAEPMHSTSAETSLEIVSNLFELPCELAIKPNPANDVISLQTGACFLDGLQLEIIDISGKKCLSREVSGNAQDIPLDGLSKGLYFVHFSDGERLLTKKLIVE